MKLSDLNHLICDKYIYRLSTKSNIKIRLDWVFGKKTNIFVISFTQSELQGKVSGVNVVFQFFDGLSKITKVYYIAYVLWLAAGSYSVHHDVMHNSRYGGFG